VSAIGAAFAQRDIEPMNRRSLVRGPTGRPCICAAWKSCRTTSSPKSPRTQFLNFRPQPGLIARDPSRGSRIERVAYFGRASAGPAWFYDPVWHALLAGMGVVFEIRDDRWFDYSDVDVVIAHRTESPTMLRQKPASKLTNGWLAGTPALLANEPAYASLRRSSLD
jgi:hypothetical protein